MSVRALPVLAVIPARYASTRFPGKPLILIQGKPMIQHVWERVAQVKGISQAFIATDDPRIESAVRAFGGEVILTSPHHPSGTDRIWEVAQKFPQYPLVLNIQGDEPLISPLILQELILAMSEWGETADIGTLVTPISGEEEWRNPNAVKAILAASGQALYFSRASIPYHRDLENEKKSLQNTYLNSAYRHLGIYLYRFEALRAFTTLPPSPLEQIEKLEQLRALEAGMRIYAHIVPDAPLGIDTPEDLNHLLKTFSSLSS